jgi:signal transduction histidine kinase
MFDRIEIFLVGFAVIVDTALLLIVREKANRSQVAVWLNVLVLGASAFHFGTFGRILLGNADSLSAQVLDDVFMSLIIVGLLLMPSGMLHSAIRMTHTELESKPKRDLRYLFAYLPMLLWPLATWLIFRSEDRSLMASIASLMPVYIVWIIVANLVATICFWRLRNRFQNAHRFFNQLVISMLLITFLAIAYAALSTDDRWEKPLRLMVCLAPLVPAALFVWAALRQRILPLVLDRTLMYGSFLILGLLLHRLTITPLSVWVRERTNIDLIIVEAIAVIGTILVVPHLRNRASEALRCLFSTNVFKVRDATRQLSVALSQNSALDAEQLSIWFARALAQQLDLDRAIVVMQSEGPDDSAVTLFEHAQNASLPALNHYDGERLCRFLQQVERLERGRVTDYSIVDSAGTMQMRCVSDTFEAQRVLVAFRASFRSVVGAVLLGDRKRNDRFAEEQMVAIALVCDQFAATMESKRESKRRIQAERSMMQSEKLSTLGLIAGSIAHELRNPLSSIRTIASLTMEDLGEKHSNHADLAMIVSEIDRLSQTARRMLDSAKPADAENLWIEPDQVLSRLLTILTPLSKKLHVDLQTDFRCDSMVIRSTEVAFSEVFFNLIKNAIEAAAGNAGGRVLLRSARCDTSGEGEVVCISVADTGPGITPTLRNTLFSPFVTGKSGGTGLGLYVVSERVKELRGTIEVVHHFTGYTESDHTESGTTFVVKLPLHDAETQSTQG